MKKWLLLVCVLLTACDRQSQGFALPPGDIEAGKAAFVRLQCNQCHQVDDIAWAGSGDIRVTLGGERTAIATYGDLVTSIINPSHRLSRGFDPATVQNDQSKMRVYNDVMTVQELIDLVTYLQTTYEVWVPDFRQLGP